MVRVNDRGPYVGDRVIDLSVQTAKLLGFYGHGLAKVKVDYVGRAPLAGSDDRKLMATLREGAPATAAPVQVASNKPFAPAYFDTRPMTQIRRCRCRPTDRFAGPRCQRRDQQAAPRAQTVELAAAARPQAPRIRRPRADAPPWSLRVSPVSAYAPTRYDGSAGFMSGRGLY